MELLLSNSRRVSREELRYVSTPRATSSWQPVPHYEFSELIVSECERRGYKITNEEYGLNSDGSKMFGVLRFHPEAHPEYSRALGMRNSHDKSLALGLVAGLSVLVCDNLCFGGATTLYRRHTSGIDIAEMLPLAFESISMQFRNLELRVADMHHEMLSIDQARLITVKAAEAKAIPSCDILPVLKDFTSPAHEEFMTPSAWSLYNAFTETAKKYSPMRAEYCYKSLGRLFRLE